MILNQQSCAAKFPVSEYDSARKTSGGESDKKFSMETRAIRLAQILYRFCIPSISGAPNESFRWKAVSKVLVILTFVIAGILSPFFSEV